MHSVDGQSHRESHRPVETGDSTNGLDLVLIVSAIQGGSVEAVEKLDRFVRPGLKYFFLRRLDPASADELTQQTILCLMEGILRHRVTQPERLLGYLRGIARNLLNHEIGDRVKRREHETGLDRPIRDSRDTPDKALLKDERVQIMQRLLERMTPRDREILVRFYLQEQSQVQICTEMGLTETQFRLHKSRAKQKLAQRCQEWESRRTPSVRPVSTEVAQIA